MKTKVRNGIFIASLACVALSSAVCLTTVNLSASADKESSKSKSNLVLVEQALKTVGKDLESIVTGYNKVFGTEWAATSIEYSSPVYLIEDDEYGMYLDLDGDNGYTVITMNNKIYCVHINGDLEYLRGAKKIYFSYMDGFMYVDDNGQFRKCEQDENRFNPFSNGNLDAPAKQDDDQLDGASNNASSSVNYQDPRDLGNDGKINPARQPES
ncbi:MAG: hypothetical protein HDT28_03200 [Clostridiales bacterium]|nr:hypothetical protein [Clostridiales bacterium]